MNKINERRAAALDRFIPIMRNSWTYDRLTEDERQRITDRITRRAAVMLGDENHMYAELQAFYSAFLDGTGYTWKGWREPEEEHTA